MTELTDIIDPANEEFRKACDILRLTDANLFLTGKAGTGKSTFLRYICKHIDKQFVVLAPTGVAAVNVGGMTIHSFFQMPLRPVPPDDPEYSVSAFSKSGKFSRKKRKLLCELELIIIDEISMVRPDTIDFIDRLLRGVRRKPGLPFGGVQLLLVGDIFQLEPVVTPDTRDILARYYQDFFFFNANAYRKAELVSVELKKIYRQSDASFIELLDKVRLNRVTEADLRLLNSRVEQDNMQKTEDKFGIILASRKDAANAINSECMEQLPGKEFVFEGVIEDDFPDKLLPTELSLTLKKDAQVMMIRNDKDRRWINGTIARVKEISEKEILIELEDGRVERVDQETWENITYTYDEKERKVKEEVLGRFIQFPLKAAWALTIHKSQGLTFNSVTIDMGRGAFSAGQTYVALSRCRSLEGLRFVNPIRKYDVIVSPGAVCFSKNYNDSAAADRVIQEASAHRLSLEAIKQYRGGAYKDSVETLWEVESLVGAFSKKSVRRLISRFLSETDKLHAKIKEQDELLATLSDEFCSMGFEIMERDADYDSALAEFEKSLRIDPQSQRALLGKAIAQVGRGERKEGYHTLDGIIKGRGERYYEACMTKGDFLAEDGDLSNAALNYQAAAKCDNGNREPIMRLVELYGGAGMDQTADMWREWLDMK